jgi:excisionase family DNA binding protein
MEKICIVKLRKELTNPIDVNPECRQGPHTGSEALFNGLSLANTGAFPKPEAHTGSPENQDGTRAMEAAVSLPLTRDQVRSLQANTHMASFMSTASAERIAALSHRDEPVVIMLELPALPPVRLLKVEEVTRMLRISKSYLNKIISQGYLKSYRLGQHGRLRRIMLEDVLSYLEDSRELADIKQQASAATSTSYPEIV